MTVNFTSQEFGPVAEVFDDLASQRDMSGAAVAAFVDGELVVDLFRPAAVGAEAPAQPPAMVWSVTKGLVASLVVVLADSGELVTGRPVADYWPEFGQASKGRILVDDVLTHRAGLPWWSGWQDAATFASSEGWADWDEICRSIAVSEPLDAYAGEVAYHALSYGWIVGEVVRRATGQDVTEAFSDLVGGPLGLRTKLRGADSREEVAALRVDISALPQVEAFDEALMDEGNALRQALLCPTGTAFSEILEVCNTEEFRRASIPAISAVSDAASLAKLYGCLAVGGSVGSVKLAEPTTVRRHTRELASGDDLVTGGPRRMGLGFALQSEPTIRFGSAANGFGHPGLGGSVAFADPDRGLGFSFVTPSLAPDTHADVRADRLAMAVYGCLG